MNRKTLTICTHDDRLWSRLQPLAKHWALVRCVKFPEILKTTGVVWIDGDLPSLPPLHSPAVKAVLSRGRLAILAAASPNDEQGLLAFNAGFVGYLHVYEPLVQLTQAIKVVEKGNLWVGQSLLARLLKSTSQALATVPQTDAWAKGLTEREQEVAKRAALGESNLEIAEACGITERTVKAHLSATFEKLGVHDRLQLSLKVHGIKTS